MCDSKSLYVVLIVLLSLFLAGCSQAPATQVITPSPSAEPTLTQAIAQPTPVKDTPQASPVAPSRTPAPGTPYPGARASQVGYPPATATLNPEAQVLPTAMPRRDLPTPQPGKGHVVGTLFRRRQSGAIEPLSSRKLYLGKVLTTRSGESSGIAGVDEKQAPFAITDSKGGFVFENLEPGQYALVIKHPLYLILAHDILQDEDIVVDVKAGTTTDVGVLLVVIAD